MSVFRELKTDEQSILEQLLDKALLSAGEEQEYLEFGRERALAVAHYMVGVMLMRGMLVDGQIEYATYTLARIIVEFGILPEDYPVIHHY